MAYIDHETGEVMDEAPAQQGSAARPAQTGQSSESLAPIQTLLMRNERLQERNDKVMDENDQLRRELRRMRSLYDDAKAAFHKKLAEAQADFKPLERDNSVEFTTRKGGAFRASTASMDEAFTTTQAALTSRGITVRQPVIDHPQDKLLSIVRTILAYEGYEEHYDISIPSPYSYSQRGGDDGDLKNFGANVSLIRKYALFAALGLVQEAKDDSKKGGRDNRPSFNKSRSAPASHQPSGNHSGTAPTQTQAQGAASGHQQGKAEILEHPELKAATSMQELATAMNSIPKEERARYTSYFRQRQAEIRNQVAA